MNLFHTFALNLIAREGMCGKWSYFLLFLIFLSLFSCKQEVKVESVEYDIDSLLTDTLQPDTATVEEKEIDEAEQKEPFDRNFDDFMYVFLRSRKLQNQRIQHPLWYVDGVGDTTQMSTSRDWRLEFAFLDDDFYTVLYDSQEQMDEVSESDPDSVIVDRIDLGSCMLTSYSFYRTEGRWMLSMVENSTFQQSVISDFLHFYAVFSADTLFQQQSIAQPLRVSLPSPDEDDGYLQGTIDASQWSVFSIDVPSGVISNVRYGQQYVSSKMIMQKCGFSSGMQELYIFEKQTGQWKLTSYEN